MLADALVEADSEDPDLIVDCATLTGGKGGREEGGREGEREGERESEREG